MKSMKKKTGVLNLFGMAPPEKIESLPREVLKWIQSLDLTYSIRNVKKDFNNGFLVAQILSRYYPVTNDINQNYKAIQMHQISNGFSMATRKDNWEQINKFIDKIGEITTRINDIDTFIKNENGEILLFIISLYQELTKRRIPLLEGKVITTDIDNYNKSYLLKENGEIEKLKKTDIDNLSSNLMPNIQNQIPIQQEEPHVEQAEKKNDEFLNTQKTTNSILSRGSQIVMKGDVKPMSLNPVQMEKGFKIKISEPKVYETITRTIYQPRQPIISSNFTNESKEKKNNDDIFGKFNSLIQDERDVEQKTISTDNPFLTLDEPLRIKINNDFNEDYNKIKIGNGNKFIFYFFKSVDDLSDNVFNFVLQYILKIIEDFYNILSGKQVNDFVDTFLLMFETYINLDNFDDESKKFSLMHEAMGNFFIKSLKNKNEEMFFIFKNIFIEKIFETINDKEYNSKLIYLCNLLFQILQPTNDQQIDLFKMFKEKTNENEEIMYECFAILHDEFKTYTDGLIDRCLFYILNGLSNENPKIRYFSLEMLLHYSELNVNFVFNFQNKLDKLSNKEIDRENCLLIIKIVCQSLKAAYVKKTQPKDGKSKGFIDKEGNNGDSEQQIYLNDISFGNKVIKVIVNRFIGDHVFILLFTNAIYDYLYDNNELYEILLDALFKVNESILDFTFYEGNLDKIMKTKYECTIFRRPVNIEKINVWNTPLLLKAYDNLIMNNRQEELSNKDYQFLRFITKDGLDVNFSDIWKTSFNFSPLIIKDLTKYENCGKCIAILDAFIQCEPIQKFIFDEWYENLSKTFEELINNNGEDIEKCRNQVLDILLRWINDQKISSIVRDDIRKLLNIFPKEMKEKQESKEEEQEINNED